MTQGRTAIGRHVVGLAAAGALSGIGLAAGSCDVAVAQVPPRPAQTAPIGSGNQPEVGGTPQSSSQPAFQGTPAQGNASIQSSLGPYGDPGGVRAALAKRGLTFNLVGILETLGNPIGGVRRGAIGEGRLDLQVDLDLKTALGLDGATLHGNGYEIFGHGLSANDLDNLSLASSIEARPSTRLYELWYEQAFLGGKVALKLGQIGADTEFLVSQYATLFVGSTFGWPNITAYDLPSGGPAYPLATPAVRLKLAPDAHWSLLSAVFDGDPSGAARFGAAADPQTFDPNGTNFRVTDAPLVITEAAYAYGDKDGPLLPGILKFGGWRHFGRFTGSFPVEGGLTLGSGTGRFDGNDGIYGLVDQMVYRVPGTDDGAIGIFARASGSPGDRNLVSFYADGGVTGKGLLPGRPDDTLGVSSAFTQLSPAAQRTDRMERAVLGLPYPVRSNEIVVEATYQAQIVPGFSVQPDVQYVLRPGGGIPDPTSPAIRSIRDAAVLGLRAQILIYPAVDLRIVVPGLIHGFVTMGGVLDAASTALDRIAAELRRRFGD